MVKEITRTFFLAGIISISVIGVVLVTLLTRWGPGLFDWDSFNYIGSARSFANGNGFQIPYSQTSLRPMLYSPPFYPLVLSLFEMLNADAIAAARWLNSVLFGINLLLFATLVDGFSHSRLFTMLSSLIFLFSADLLIAHAWALSEPLLLFFILCSLLLFRIWQTRQGPIWIALLYISIALGVMTKFAGAALAPTIALLFLLSKSSRKSKLLLALGAVWSGFIPFAIWSIRNYLVSATFHGFSFSYVPIRRGNMVSAFITLFTWFIPENWLFGREKLVLIISLIIVLASGIYLIRTSLRERISSLTILGFSSLFVIFYLLIVVLAKMLFDHGIGFRDRMLIPLFPLILVSIFFVASSFYQRFGRWGKLIKTTIIG